MDRGIIVPPVELSSHGPLGISFDRGLLTPENLRYFFLYWDKIAVVSNTLIRFGLTGEAERLASAGVITEEVEEVVIFGEVSITQRLISELQTKAAQRLIKKNPGQWSFHQTGDKLIIPPEMSIDLVTAEISLYQCLPVPPNNISLDQISDFKYRRQDELLALRDSLDRLYLDVSKSGDVPRARIVAIGQLEKALIDINRVCSESWTSTLFANRRVSIDLNLGAIKDAITTGAASASVFNIPTGIALGAIFGLAGCLKFEADLTRQAKELQGQQIDLSYISNLKKESLI
ncbi:MAG: hypothetical protein GAK45_00121 [Pseudomonas citronellolis]|nr:MAG: hypothetical protein GAK45_00121 [Pseudomonas citronellolis]